jgi:DNA-binding HxlR family transcriptional regulator/peroxiredoxin
MKYTEISGDECAIAQALGVVGEWWTLLIVRDVAGGIHRFDALYEELGLSRRLLAERLVSLVDSGVLERRQYNERPPRYEYHLTPMGRGLLPVLVSLQEWGARYLLGDGTLTATTRPRSMEARRVRRLVGTRIPQLSLVDSSGAQRDPVSDRGWTVIFCFPGAYADPATYPSGWKEIPGATGCTLEATAYRDHLEEFTARGAQVHGVSTQSPSDQAAFAAKTRISYPLLSDQALQLTAALRLPTFRVAGVEWLKRATLIVDADREIRAVQYPLTHPAESVAEALDVVDRLSRGSASRRA